MIHKIETFIEDKKAISVNDDIVNIFNSKTNEYVLCIGEVQSGKTNAILRSLRRCYKLNYKIAIVLGGVNNSLNYQTINDIKNEFAKETSQGKASIITKDNFISFSKYGNKRMKDDVFYIVCLLKGADALKKLKEYFLDSVFSKDYDAAIFDDECDYASVQTFRDQKTISKLIKLMQENFNSVKSLSITGTPFSNIRNKAFNKYDSSMIIKHGNEYTGSEYFINHNKNTYMSIPGKDLQDILFNSLCTWLYSTAINLLDNGRDAKSEFLINIDQKKKRHVNIKQLIIEQLEKLSSYTYEWINSKTEFSFSKIKFLDSKYSMEDITDKMYEIIDFLKRKNYKSIYIFNSDNEKYTSNDFQFAIVIGGAMLSRGIRFKNLITELIMSKTKKLALDTLLQKARWFGYRHDKFKYITIYMNDRLIEAFNDANELVTLVNGYGNNLTSLIIKIDEFQKHLKKRKVKLSNKR